MNCLNESLSYEQYTLSSFPILKSISKAITCLLYISHLFCSNYMSKSLSNRMHFSSIFPQHSMAMVLKQEITKSSVITNKYVDTWSVHICGHECGYSLCCCFLPLVAIVNRCGWDGEEEDICLAWISHNNNYCSCSNYQTYYLPETETC